MAGIDMMGRTFGELTVIERAGVSPNRQLLWLVLCSCGRERVVRGYNLRSGHTTTCDHSHDPSYRAIHGRLGDATAHVCVECGEQADEWAYNNAAEHELVDLNGRYSAELSDYMPLCRSHHRMMDAEHRLDGTCPEGHSREEYEIRDNRGWRRCSECHRLREQDRRRRLSSLDA